MTTRDIDALFDSEAKLFVAALSFTFDQPKRATYRALPPSCCLRSPPLMLFLAPVDSAVRMFDGAGAAWRAGWG